MLHNLSHLWSLPDAPEPFFFQKVAGQSFFNFYNKPPLGQRGGADTGTDLH